MLFLRIFGLAIGLAACTRARLFFSYGEITGNGSICALDEDIVSQQNARFKGKERNKQDEGMEEALLNSGRLSRDRRFLEGFNESTPLVHLQSPSIMLYELIAVV